MEGHTRNTIDPSEYQNTGWGVQSEEELVGPDRQKFGADVGAGICGAGPWAWYGYDMGYEGYGGNGVVYDGVVYGRLYPGALL